MAEPTVSAWHRLLDDLDQQLVQIGRPLGAGDPELREIAEIRRLHEPLGEMPAEVVERARGVLAEYEIAVARLQDARRKVGEHLLILQSVKYEPIRRPVYLDKVG